MNDPEEIDEDSMLWLAPDIPNPTEYAEALVIIRPKIAREMMAAVKTRTGYRMHYPEHQIVAEMRELGLCSEDGRAWYLSNYALLVRNRLIRLMKSGRLQMTVIPQGAIPCTPNAYAPA